VTPELRDIFSTATSADVGFTRGTHLPAPGEEVELNARRLDAVRTRRGARRRHVAEPEKDAQQRSDGR
jgi:hypothetical protein